MPPQPPARATLPQPEPLKQEPFTFKAVTVGDESFLALTADEYASLAKDLSDMLRYVRESKWLLDYYEGKHDGEAQPTEGNPPSH